MKTTKCPVRYWDPGGEHMFGHNDDQNDDTNITMPAATTVDDTSTQTNDQPTDTDDMTSAIDALASEAETTDTAVEPSTEPEATEEPTTTPEEPAEETPTETETPVTPSAAPANNDELLNIKREALENLAPLVDHLDQTPEEKFKTNMMMIQATDDSGLVKQAYEAANSIEDEKVKAQALLDIVNEINYFTQQHNS